MKMLLPQTRTRPVGAEIINGGVHFRVWAPRRERLSLVLIDEAGTASFENLVQEDNGYFARLIPGIEAGQRYFLQVDDDPKFYPDPASCFQPEGVHGPSEVIDHTTYRWNDDDWPGVKLYGQVIYEMHVGTWTPEGTWAAATSKLPNLADMGITLVEVMPVADFHGRFGWGYDGVCWYAPTRLYGRPDDFRHFVDEAHHFGLGVILDVVYNHLGPTGNYTGAFSHSYVSKKHSTEWGDALNVDGENSAPVREFIVSNAAYWIRDFHLDGMRLDAIQMITDDSPRHVLGDLSVATRQAAGNRSIVIFSEDEHQQARNFESPDEGGYGLDGTWNDDFHHACRVASTGHAEYYYTDYNGTPQEIISATKYGFLYQGQWNQRQKKHRGAPVWNQPAARFVNALQNHDQVANSTHGYRGHQLTSPGRWRALTALQLLAPGTPLLFMGQEFMTSKPFLYFADHEVEIAELVRHGRLAYLRQFPRTAGAALASGLDDPADEATFEASKLDWSEVEKNMQAVALHKDLLALRKSDPIFSQQDATQIHGAVIGPEALALRWFSFDGDDRLVLLNLGRDLECRPASQPLFAPPFVGEWAILWSSEDPHYGGAGTAILNFEQLAIPGHALVVLAPN